MRLRGESGLVQNGVQHISRTVTGEHTAGAIRPVGAGREPDDQNTTVWISKGRNRTAPILPIQIGTSFNGGDLSAMFTQSGTPITLQDFLLQPINR